MEDEEIINLYWKKQEKAIYETDKKYGNYCNTISFNILQNNEESKECVNDTYLKTWNSIPPQRPNVLNIFLSELSQDKRKIFLERYWYLYSIKEISSNNRISESNVKTILLRIRSQLKNYLKEGGLYG